MQQWADREEKEALGAVRTLKRALGIPGHPDKQDQFADEQIHIYTPDRDSAEILAEHLFRYGNGKRAKFYDEHPEKLTIRDTVRVDPLPEGGFEASMSIPHPTHFRRMILKMVEKHIAPDTKFKR